MRLRRRIRRVAALEKIFHVEKRKIIDPLGNVFFHRFAIVRHRIRETGIVQPHAYRRFVLSHGDHGVQFRAFKHGGAKHRKFERRSGFRF